MAEIATKREPAIPITYILFDHLVSSKATHNRIEQNRLALSASDDQSTTLRSVHM